MARCHDCDRYIEGDDVCWREVKVGSSRAAGLGYLAGHFLPFLGGVTHRRKVRLCPACAAARDGRRAEASRRFNVRLGVILFLWALVVIISLAAASCGAR